MSRFATYTEVTKKREVLKVLRGLCGLRECREAFVVPGVVMQKEIEQVYASPASLVSAAKAAIE